MESFANRYHNRMADSYRALFELLHSNKEVIPVLQDAVNTKIVLSPKKRQLVLEFSVELQKIFDQEDEATRQMGAATGHLMEEQEVLDEVVQDHAQLTTAAQLFGIAPYVDSETIREFLEKMEMPAFEEAIQETDPERLNLILGVISKVLGQKRA